jgi:hypothetical protein
LSFCPFSLSHCVVWPPLIYSLWLPFWYLVDIVLSVLLRFTVYDYAFGILDLWFMITPLVSSNLSCIVFHILTHDILIQISYVATIHLNDKTSVTILVSMRRRRGHYRLAIGCTPAYEISDYCFEICKFASRTWWGVLDTNFWSTVCQVILFRSVVFFSQCSPVFVHPHKWLRQYNLIVAESGAKLLYPEKIYPQIA